MSRKLIVHQSEYDKIVLNKGKAFAENYYVVCDMANEIGGVKEMVEHGKAHNTMKAENLQRYEHLCLE